MPYNAGYYSTITDAVNRTVANFVRILPVKSLIWIGTRPKGQKVGRFALTRNIPLDLMKSGEHGLVENRSSKAFADGIGISLYLHNRLPFRYELDVWFNGGPRRSVRLGHERHHFHLIGSQASLGQSTTALGSRPSLTTEPPRETPVYNNTPLNSSNVGLRGWLDATERRRLPAGFAPGGHALGAGQPGSLQPQRHLHRPAGRLREEGRLGRAPTRHWPASSAWILTSRSRARSARRTRRGSITCCPRSPTSSPCGSA